MKKSSTYTIHNINKYEKMLCVTLSYNWSHVGEKDKNYVKYLQTHRQSTGIKNP